METEVLVKNCQAEAVDRKRLILATRKSLQYEHFDRASEVSIVLVGDAEMRELSRDYRGIDRPTDVLSFSQMEGELFTATGIPLMLGDVVISVETAQKQAADRGHSLEDELELLVIHGVLHLLGYDDETEEQAAEMREHELAILEQLRHDRAA